MLISYEEFLRLKERDRRAYSLDDMPDDVAQAILESKVPDELE